MALNSLGSGCALTGKLLDNLIRLLWGTEIKDDVFQRWNQGFAFSDNEPSALLQYDGGPCAVIVSVQAFLLKNLLFSSTTNEGWRQISGIDRDRAFCQALADILHQVESSSKSVTIVFSDSRRPVVCDVAGNSSSTALPTGDRPPENAMQSNDSKTASDPEMPSPSTISNQVLDDASPKRQRFSHERLHSNLRCINVDCGAVDLKSKLEQFLPMFYDNCGVLLFLYSVLLTKGLDEIKKDVDDEKLSEAFIDSMHGHGSQSLINLLITGKAVPHIWDNEIDVTGLKLQGISCQSNIGFLTLLEYFQYCEVGWHLKNPLYPIWLLGSETHLTLLFSEDKTLVGEESSEAFARRMFNSFDREGRGFITVESLGPLMTLLSLVSVPEYVNIMAEKLDPEQLGVITLNSFLEEFYSSDKSKHDALKTFTMYHYNGLPRSNQQNKVCYSEAKGAIMASPEVQMMSDFSQIKNCLLTKWPTIEMTWKDDRIPSMN